MRAGEQWERIRANLPEDWDEARLVFTVEDPGSMAAAAAVLAPLGPGRTGDNLRFHIRNAGSGPQSVANLLARLDRRRIWGTLSLTEARALAAVTDVPGTDARLADAWDDAIARLTSDWSDLLCELELDSSDHVPRAALLGAPLNPTRNPDAIALRFRVSGKQGYGVSPGMARRCFERMDADGITGRISVLYGLSDTENAVTQGPVWRLAGRSV